MDLRVSVNEIVTLSDIFEAPFFSPFDFYRFTSFNPFKPAITIVIFIHYKPRIAVAILDL